jgi:acetolactate decarboxylase
MQLPQNQGVSKPRSDLTSDSFSYSILSTSDDYTPGRIGESSGHSATALIGRPQLDCPAMAYLIRTVPSVGSVLAIAGQVSYGSGMKRALLCVVACGCFLPSNPGAPAQTNPIDHLTGDKSSKVFVIGEMRRMFTAHDIGANVELRTVLKEPHVYALGPVAGLKGEITIVDSQAFVSKANAAQATISLEPDAKAIFLVYASVPAWREVQIPTNVVTEAELGAFLQRSLRANSRTAFLVRGTALHARYHIQNFQGKAEDLTHEVHDKAKVSFNLSNTPVELVGFFTNREDDGGSFVHQGQTTHIHVISDDHKSMGHLESITLAPGAKLLLPQGN